MAPLTGDQATRSVTSSKIPDLNIVGDIWDYVSAQLSKMSKRSIAVVIFRNFNAKML